MVRGCSGEVGLEKGGYLENCPATKSNFCCLNSDSGRRNVELIRKATHSYTSKPLVLHFRCLKCFSLLCVNWSRYF